MPFKAAAGHQSMDHPKNTKIWQRDLWLEPVKALKRHNQMLMSAGTRIVDKLTGDWTYADQVTHRTKCTAVNESPKSATFTSDSSVTTDGPTGRLLTLRR